MLAVLGLLFARGSSSPLRMASIDYPAMGISRGFLYAALPADDAALLSSTSSRPRSRALGRAARVTVLLIGGLFLFLSWASPSPSRCC